MKKNPAFQGHQASTNASTNVKVLNESKCLFVISFLSFYVPVNSYIGIKSTRHL